MSKSAGNRRSAAPAAILARIGSLFPRTIDLSLDRVFRLLEDLGSPHLHLPPVIHVAGTNGKGSTIAFLRSLLETSGLKVHVYTSPHLVDFSERIRIAGKLIDDAELSSLLAEVEVVNAGRPITFFEATTAAALLAFSRHDADYTIIETGMGGRLDATNVVPNPIVTAITPISRDHTQYLGNTIANIAREKAGIFRLGVPIAIGPQSSEAMRTLGRCARQLGAPIFGYGGQWRVEQIGARLLYRGRQQLILPRPPLAGDHQLGNAGLALAIVDQLPNLQLSSADYMRGILGAEWPARLMTLPHHLLGGSVPARTEIIVDGGHNCGAGQALASWAHKFNGKLDLIVGMLNTRDPREFLRPLAPYARRLRGVAIPDAELSLDSDRIVAAARKVGIHDVAAAESVTAAISALARDGSDRILICGSLHLAGSVLSSLRLQVR